MLGRPWSFRTKRFLRLAVADDTFDIPSTIVLGPLDVVNYGNGDLHLSWYPAGLEGFSTRMMPPDLLPLDPATARGLRNATVAGLPRVTPALSNLDLPRAVANGGAIFALETRTSMI